MCIPLVPTASRAAPLHHIPAVPAQSDPSHSQEGDVASAKSGEAAAEPQEWRVMGMWCWSDIPTPQHPKVGKQLPHKMPHKPPPHPRVSSQLILTSFPNAGGSLQAPQSKLDFVGDPKQLKTLQGPLQGSPLPIPVPTGGSCSSFPKETAPGAQNLPELSQTP